MNRPAEIVGVFEHPGRHLPDKSISQIHAEVALAALADAGLSLSDVDGYCVAGEPAGLGPLTIAEYLGLRCTYVDSTDVGGSAPVLHVGHAADAIAAKRCNVVLITMAGKPRTGGSAPGDRARALTNGPESSFEAPFGPTTAGMYALSASRHMYEFGTTSSQLAAVKVAAASHAQHNPNAFLREPVTIEQVLESPLVADPLHRLDCCVVTDGGGAIVLVSPEVARSLSRRSATVLGYGEAPKHTLLGRPDLTYTGARWSGAAAFAAAGVGPADVDYASIYDSFTITVVETIEDLGFCEKGKGGPFVASGALHAPDGALPFNTDGGGLCNNHPGNRGGVTKVIEAVRQLRGEAAPPVQVPDCEVALVHGTGGSISSRTGAATLLLASS